MSEVKKTVKKSINGQEIDSIETAITATCKSWRSMKFCRLQSRIFNAYLEAIDLAKDGYPVEITDTKKKEENRKADYKEKTIYRDNLNHYEKLYRCYIEKKRVGLKKLVIICTTIIICFTIGCCLFSPRFNSQKYEAFQTSAITTTIGDTSYSVENSLSVGSK